MSPRKKHVESRKSMDTQTRDTNPGCFQEKKILEETRGWPGDIPLYLVCHSAGDLQRGVLTIIKAQGWPEEPALFLTASPQGWVL